MMRFTVFSTSYKNGGLFLHLVLNRNFRGGGRLKKPDWNVDVNYGVYRKGDQWVARIALLNAL